MNINLLLSLPKSIVVNFKLFNYSIAKKLPVLVSYDTKFSVYRETFEINDKINFGMIRFGFGGSEGVARSKSQVIIHKNGKMTFDGSANFSSGISVVVKGTVRIGDNFYCNRNCSIACDKLIKIGANTLLGYNVEIRDGDGHYVGVINKETVEYRDNTKEVNIEDHVWIAAKASILKGSTVFKDSVVAYGACVTGGICDNEPHVVLGGVPARVIQQHSAWKK